MTSSTPGADACCGPEGSPDSAPPQPNGDDGPKPKRSIDSHYERRVGLCHAASLVLNAGLMLYAHLGLSGVVYSSVDTALSAADLGAGTCDARDREAWASAGGDAALPVEMDRCIGADGGCGTNATCVEYCITERYGLSGECAACFQPLLPCGIREGCFSCLVATLERTCLECMVPCVGEMHDCGGLPVAGDFLAVLTNATGPDLSLVGATAGVGCNDFDLEAIEEWYPIYEASFVEFVRYSWDNGARALACVIVFFSGIWPYAKNILLLIVWYVPMTVERQTLALVWLAWLSKYTLVDVFAVVGVLVGVQLQLSIGGVVEAVTRAEPRFGIICFFLATAWEFVEIETIKYMHEQKVLVGQEARGEGKESLFLSKLWIPALATLATIGLYISGTVMEVLRIESSDYGSEEVCVKSYNLVQLGNALVNDQSLMGNSVPGQTWFLYLVYVVLNLVLPILTHLMQIAYIAGRFRSKGLESVIHWATAVWCFACIEVFIIGMVAVQSKFDQFVLNVASLEDQDLLDIESSLGNGVYVLIAYSVVACALQFFLEEMGRGTVQSLSKSSGADEEESSPE